MAERGRPTKYKEEYCDEVFKLCVLGVTDKQIADFFNVDEATINRWKKSHPDFCESLKNGKERADAQVAESLRKRALGYDLEETRLDKDGEEVTVSKHYPADVTACIFWLKNRRPDLWRDRVDANLNHGGQEGNSVKITFEMIDAKK